MFPEYELLEARPLLRIKILSKMTLIVGEALTGSVSLTTIESIKKSECFYLYKGYLYPYFIVQNLKRKIQSQRGSSGMTGSGWVINPTDPYYKLNETTGLVTEVPFKPACIGWAMLFALLCFILLFVESQVAELIISGEF